LLVKTQVAATMGVALLVIACGSSDTGAGDSKYPIRMGPDMVAAGAEIYAANCFTCHGDDAQPPLLPAAPPHTVDGHTWHHQDRQLVEWILDGVPLGQVMPKFRGILTEDEAISALAYIKTFWPDEVRERQTESSLEYEKQLAEFGDLP
jgi:mono/diheme cytochrome c family protein